MKKYLPIIAVVVVLGLAVGGWYFIKNGSSQTEKTTPIEMADETSIEGESEKLSVSGKLEDLLSLGQAVKCTWQDVENNTGVAFVKGEQIYTESIANGVKTYYVSRNDCTWYWQDGQTTGYKICVEPDDKEVEEEESELPQGFSVNTGTMSYNCVPQIIDDTRFEVPAGIEFVDFAQMMQMNLPQVSATE